MAKLQSILDRLDQIEIKKAHDELTKKRLESPDDPNNEGYAFEVGDTIQSIPYRTLREYLQTGKATDPQSVVRSSDLSDKDSSISELLNSNGASVEGSEKEFEDGYYWDSNMNYEYMNPESKRRRVLESK